jgi:hypothetical protein
MSRLGGWSHPAARRIGELFPTLFTLLQIY